MSQGLKLFAAAGAAFLVVAVMAGFSLVRTAEGDAETDPANRAEIEEVVRDYILENPEILQQAAQRLRQREVAGAIEANREALETPFASAWAGNEDGDVVLVEFFDYACPYCRRAHEDVQRLLSEDDNLKVVWRQMPVLGPGSRDAAEAALAAAKAGRYRAYHNAMFEDPRRVTAEKAASIAGEVGLDSNALVSAEDSQAIRAEIDTNLGLARALGVSGTPAYFIGDQRIDGAAGYDALKAAIAAARDAG